MAKQSRESMIGELEARNIGYDTQMSDKELEKLLKKAQDKEKAAEKKHAEKQKLEAEIDYSGVMCGLSTIQNIHRRLTIVERKLGLDK